MTQSVTLAEGVAHVFVAVDHCNSECVGIHADKSANCFRALEPVRQGVRRHFSAIGKDVAAPAHSEALGWRQACRVLQCPGEKLVRLTQ